MTRKDKRQDEQQNDQDGGVLPKSKKPSAATKASMALSKPKEGAIEKPTAAESAESMSVDMYGDEDVEMKLLRRSMRSKAKPQAFVPGSVGPKKSRGPLTEEQKAARKAAREAAQAAAEAAKQEASRALPDPEALAKAREEQEIVALAQQMLDQKMELDIKRPSRTAKGKVNIERQWKLAYEEAKKQYASQKKAQKQAVASEADILADLFGQMTTTRPSAPQSFGTHSSGHAIVGYDPKDGWPLGVNPVTGQVERFATREGGKKKRTYKKKAQKGGEVEGAVAEDSKSQAAPVSGGKKKRTNKKNN